MADDVPANDWLYRLDCWVFTRQRQMDPASSGTSNWGRFSINSEWHDVCLRLWAGTDWLITQIAIKLEDNGSERIKR